MIDTDKYEGHTLNNLEIDADLPTWGVYDGNGKVVADYNPTDDVDINEANARLIADAPLLLEEVKRLHKEVDQLSIDVCESLELILDVHHPEVKDSVMSMFGDAIGNNWPYYETLE